jgi:hypothetical protein
MAQNATLSLPAETGVLLTDSDVTALTFQILAPYGAFVSATIGATPPSNTSGAFFYGAGEGEINVALTDLAPAIAATRVYAYSPRGGSALVSHA